MMKNWIFPALILAVARFSSAILEVQENSPVTIQCPLNVQYPTWSGPSGLQNPLTSGQTINEAGFQWVNNRDLRITSAMLKHDGTYTCRDGSGNTGTVEVDVQYFSAWADISSATPEDNEVNFSCEVHSNPRAKIIPSTYTRQHDPPAKTIFHECEPDPTRDNKLKCSMTSTGYVQKEDNGREVQCEFIYKNMSYMTLVKKINFLFPPTFVKIMGNSSRNNLTLTCATNSSNPVSTLTWRIGKSAVASENAAITSAYQSTIMDAEYNGQNITQKIYIVVKSNMDKVKVFCCARHRNNDYCDSVTVTSDGCVATCLMSLLVVTVAFITNI